MRVQDVNIDEAVGDTTVGGEGRGDRKGVLSPGRRANSSRRTKETHLASVTPLHENSRKKKQTVVARGGERGGATVAPPTRGERNVGPKSSEGDDRHMPLKRTQQFVVFTFLQSELKTWGRGEGVDGRGGWNRRRGEVKTRNY